MLGWEGCLSIPGLRAAVPRADAHSLSRRRLRRQCDRAGGHRLPRAGRSARVRPSGRHPLYDAHDRFPLFWLHRGTRPRRRRKDANDRTPRTTAGARRRHRWHAAERAVRRLDEAGAAGRGARRPGCRPTRRTCCFRWASVDMIETFCDLADRRMEEAAAALPETQAAGAGPRGDRAAAGAEPAAQGSGPPRDVGAGVAANARAAAELHRSHCRRDLACRGRPLGGFQLVHQARACWRRSTARRCCIGCATRSEDDAATLAFLDRRLAGGWTGCTGCVLPKPMRLLARLPRPPRLAECRVGVGDTG